MYANLLTGTMPTELGKLTGLNAVDLGGNSLAGRVPSELSTLHFLQVLSVEQNRLTDTFPVLPSSLEAIELYGNRLIGQLPPMSRFSSLGTLFVHNNAWA